LFAASTDISLPYDIGLAYVGEWMVADDSASGRLVEISMRVDAFVSRILPLLSRIPPHGADVTH
jgi:hypothetical protein